MFTGLIQSLGRLLPHAEPPRGAQTAAHAAGQGPIRLHIRPDDPAFATHPAPLALGESISVSGVCLTLAALDPDATLAFDVVPETLRRTSASRWIGTAPGAVNLERSVTPASLMGGHLVQGHVDGVGRVLSVEAGAEHRIRIAPPERTQDDVRFMEWIVPKGSVCVEGVSLTIAALDPAAGWFEVALVPTTLAKTTLGELRAGHDVNLEGDVVVKTLTHWARHFAPPVPPASQPARAGGDAS